MSKPNWLENEGLEHKAIQELTNTAFALLGDAYHIAEKSNFVHRNWFRSQETLKEIDSRIGFLLQAGKGSFPFLLSRP